jgi:uncharacterized membrane protein YkoI
LVVPAFVLALLAASSTARAAGNDEEALKQLEANKLTLAKSVEAAETFSKGKAVAAHVKVDAKTSEVMVDCLVNDKCMEVPVDIKTGKATKMTEASKGERKDEHLGKAKDIAKQLDTDKMTLAKAIEAAETHAKGKALSITPKLKGEKLELTVHTLAGGKAADVTVDAKTGKATTPAEGKGGSEKKPGDKKQ